MMSLNQPSSELPLVPRSADVQELQRLCQGIRKFVGQITSAAEGDETKESDEVAKRARSNFLALRETWNTLADFRQENDAETTAALDELYAYFLAAEQNPADGNNFTLQNAVNAVVRTYDDQRFLITLLQKIMADKSSPEKERLAIKATEFDASRKRRLGFHMIQNEGKKDEGTALVRDAEGTFMEVLQHWQHRNDLQSQSRTLYELGMIAWEFQDWEPAAQWQDESAEIAKLQNDTLSEYIARITAIEARVLGHLTPNPAQTVEQLRDFTEQIRALAKTGNPVAQSWVSNALFIQAEACIEAGKQRVSESNTADASSYKNEAMECCDAIINDIDGYLALLKEQDRKIQGRAKGLRAVAESIQA